MVNILIIAYVNIIAYIIFSYCIIHFDNDFFMITMLTQGIANLHGNVFDRWLAIDIVCGNAALTNQYSFRLS